MAAAKPSLGRVLPGSSILFLCDMQEKFRHVAYFPQIVSVAARMLKVARLLEVPTVLTEQYPQGLGPTVPELGAAGLQPLPKTCFSMVPVARQELDARPQLRSVLLCGVETQAWGGPGRSPEERERLACPFAAKRAKEQREQRPSGLPRKRGPRVLPDTLLPLQIQKIIKEPAPDSGLLGLFQGQNPLLR
ncbi:PREDICTED: isochorismatase domain-containing protein 2, mitochondrial [Myotis brandtii]|uniref:isochorismatase domain-containing protein 2, mitochondrial n=1 Tax=Myotis brandtii TaxID=109478 RepID=UPI0003BB9791|nr:PREDICTED: isochorismatase domain-containing protein 2, mitochondrial [Myotis brandtii]